MSKVRDTIARIEQASGQIVTAINMKGALLNNLETQRKALGLTCTGSPSWRDEDHPTRGRKLTIIHPVDATCPLHGDPPKDGDRRIRLYIGTPVKEIELGLDAMKRNVERIRLEKMIRNIDWAVNRAMSALADYYRAIGWRVNMVGKAEPND